MTAEPADWAVQIPRQAHLEGQRHHHLPGPLRPIARIHRALPRPDGLCRRRGHLARSDRRQRPRRFRLWRTGIITPGFYFRIRLASIGLPGIPDRERLQALRAEQPVDTADLDAIDAADQ